MDSFGCGICEKQFTTKKALKVHINRTHGERMFVCQICGIQFKIRNSLQRHIKRTHETKFECAACGEQFNRKRRLQSHIHRTHQIHDEINFVCTTCDKQFQKKKSFESHISRVHSERRFECSQCNKKFPRKCEVVRHLKNNKFSCNRMVPLSKKQHSHGLKCGFCNSYFSSRRGIQQHFQTNHNITLSRELLQFNSEEDFKHFKLNYQRKTTTQFVIRDSRKNSNGTSKLYKCHRSGLHEPKKGAIKFPKMTGQKKIQSYCPAEMLVKCFEDGKCVVDFQQTHVGHNISDQNELSHIIYLDPDEQELTEKIRPGVPINTNRIKEVLASWEIEETNKLELLTNQDIQNVAENYNIQNEFRLAFDDDLINLEAFAKMHAPSVLFFKNQSEEDRRFNVLVKDDFALIIMNEFQEMNLLRYGKNIIAFDGTYGTNKYNFILHTLLVMDINYEGVPAAFLVSNRNDDVIINIFLQCIREQIGVFIPRVIMSNMQQTYKNSWVEVMQNEPNFTLWCTWHVREEWSKNYCKVSNKKKREDVKRAVLNFAHELDPALFQIKLNEFLSTSDVDLIAFITYFRKQYVENGKSLKWAYCYRKGVGIHTDISLESFHRSLNYYVNGKKMDWLTCTLYCIHKYLSIKVNSEDIAFYEANKLKILRQKHHEARKTKDVTSKVHIINSNSWLVESFEKENMAYFIEKREIKECAQYEGVICRLYCDLCKICFHEYSCNCLDAVIRNNMCKHIHAVGILQSTSETDTAKQLDEKSFNVETTIAQKTTLLSNSSNKSSQKLEQVKVEKPVQLRKNEIENTNALEKDKQDIRNWINDILEKIPNRQILIEIKERLFKSIIDLI